MANYKSHRDGQFVESMATGLPAKTIERSMIFDSLRRRVAVALGMDMLVIVILPEGIPFPLQIRGVLEQGLVQEFAANCADQPFQKRVR